MSRGVHHVAAVHIARAAQTTPYTQTNLVSDGAVPAAIIDKNLLNPWGIAFKPTTSTPASPFWISDNGKGVAAPYKVDPATNTPTTQALVVTIPPGKATTSATATPTGVVFNGNPNEFGGASFIFVTEDGTISAWSGGTSAVLKVDNSAWGGLQGAGVGAVTGHVPLRHQLQQRPGRRVHSDFPLVNHSPTDTCSQGSPRSGSRIQHQRHDLPGGDLRRAEQPPSMTTSRAAGMASSMSSCRATALLIASRRPAEFALGSRHSPGQFRELRRRPSRRQLRRWPDQRL